MGEQEAVGAGRGAGTVKFGGQTEEWIVPANGCEFSLTSNENIPKFIVPIDAQLCEYTKSHSIVPFKYVTCLVCELYLSRDVILRNHNNYCVSLIPRSSLFCF